MGAFLKDPWWILSIFAGFASFALWADQNTKWGKALGATNISLIVGMVLVNISVIPSWSNIHGVIFSHAVPIGISLLLFQANVKKSVKLGPKLLLAMAIGTVATCVGALIAPLVFNVGPETWKVYGMYAATYIGGSANLAAVGTGLNIDASIFAAVNAADVIVFFVWMMFLAQAGKWISLKKHYPQREIFTETLEEKEASNKTIFGYDAGISLGLAIVCSAIGIWLGKMTKIPAILITTTIVLLLANFTPISKIKVATELGLWFFMMFFVAIGSLAVVKDVVAAGPRVFYGASTLIALHGISLLVLGKVFRIPLEYLIVSSSANVGGPSTAGPQAAAYGWEDLVAPGVLMGVIGAAVGTYIGFGLAYFLRSIIG
ncbi:MAG: DUF819 domain-containing protein [Synergistales bacterium]